jgi:hypothetical protein
MNKWQRRFEVLLPRKFNDGSVVPDDLLAKTILELEGQFGALSSETQVIHGIWAKKGRKYRDELVRIFVDVDDDKANRKFFARYKTRLKKRFRQLDIRITTYLVEEI